MMRKGARTRRAGMSLSWRAVVLVAGCAAAVALVPAGPMAFAQDRGPSPVPVVAAAVPPAGAYESAAGAAMPVSFTIGADGMMSDFSATTDCYVYTGISILPGVVVVEAGPDAPVVAGEEFFHEWQFADGTAQFGVKGTVASDGTASGVLSGDLLSPDDGSITCAGEVYEWSAQRVGAAESEPDDSKDTDPGDTDRPAATGQAFRDVPQGHQFYRQIQWMFDEELSTGSMRGDSRYYDPKVGVSREAMAAFLYRLAGKPEFPAPTVSPFADLTPNSKFYREITWLAAQGITTGVKQPSGKPKYLPKTRVSREAMAAFIYRIEH